MMTNVKKAIQQNVNYRMRVVGMGINCMIFFNFFYMFEYFHNKMIEEKGKSVVWCYGDFTNN